MSNNVTEAHFSLFLNEHRSFQKEQSDTLVKFTKLMNKQADYSDFLKDKLLLSEKKISELEGRINHLEIKLLQSETTNLQSKNCVNASFSQKIEKPTPKVAKLTPDDPCEILLSGISSSVTQSRLELVNRLFLFIGISCALNHVSAIRGWKEKQQKSAFATRAFVVKFTSSLVRNEVLNKIRSSKNLNSHNIYGSSNHTKINAIDLLPKSTYLILLKARKLYKTINYAPPICKNATVYMQKFRHSPLIPIFTEDDFNKLPTGT